MAAAGVMALGAQTALAAPDVVKYDTEQYITKERGLVEGGVTSEVRECMEGRRVILFKRQRGADRKVRTIRTVFKYGRGDWTVLKSSLKLQPGRYRVYAKVTAKVGDGFVCPADRSATIGVSVHPRHHQGHPAVQALASQTALAGGDPAPDLQLSGKKTQELGNAVKVKASCGDEACNVIATGNLTNVKEAATIGQGKQHAELKSAEADLAPGETTTLKLKLTKKIRKKADEKVDNGNKVLSKVIVDATDAAGNEAKAKRTITLVK